MKAALVIVGLVLVVAGCTGPVASPTPALTTGTTPSSATSEGSHSTQGTTAAPTAGAPRTPVAGRPGDLVLGGTAIGDRPLGATPQGVLDADLVALLGAPKVGGTQLCQLVGDRTLFAVVDHSWRGLTVHYRRIGADTIAIGWRVALERVPRGVRLVDRLPWRPTFAELAAGNGAEVESAAGIRTARLSGRAISYAGPVGSSSPDTVTGGPELACR